MASNSMRRLFLNSGAEMAPPSSFLPLFNELCPCFCPETRVKPTDEIVTSRCGKNPNRVLVYMFVPPSSETSKEILRTIAIEKEPTEEVEIYNWKLIKGEHRNETSQQRRVCVWKPVAFQALFNFSGFSCGAPDLV